MIDGENTETTETETSTTEVTDQTTETDNTGSDDTSLMNAGPDDEAGDSNVNDETGDTPKAELPERYELTPPDGFEIDDTLLAQADPVLRDLKLSNEQANKLMPLVGSLAESIFKAQNDAFATQATDWAKAAKADAEIGGKNWAVTENNVAKALDHFQAPKQFRELLDSSKLGNHPEMIRMFSRIGAALGEGGDLARSDASAPVKSDRLSALYPNDVPKTESA